MAAGTAASLLKGKTDTHVAFVRVTRGDRLFNEQNIIFTKSLKGIDTMYLKRVTPVTHPH